MQDERWNEYRRPSDFAEFHAEVVPELYLKATVDDRIQNEIQTIRALFVHSFIQFDFAEIGVSRATHIFEMALRIRYEEVTKTVWDSRPLRQLILWFFDNGYFETSNLKYIDHIRDIRNDATHLSSEQINHYPRFFFAEKITIAINDVYECPLLRSQRFSYRNKINEAFKSLFVNGATLERVNSTLLIYNADVIFVNNKFPDPLVTVRFWPIFEVVNESINELPIIIDLPQSRILEKSDSIVFDAADGPHIFRHAAPGDEVNTFNDWNVRASKPRSEIAWRIPFFDDTLFHELHKKFHKQD
jgi:hypothetical protein